MREIKFRTWNETKRKMVEVRQIIIPDGNNESGQQELSVSGLKFGTNPSYWLIASPLMQYTGLLDKNGVEIYEGDIVKWHTLYEREDDGVEERIDRISFNGMIPGYFPLYYNARWKCDVVCEVIGNIHENPELLMEEEK